jgi:hypothetical protein
LLLIVAVLAAAPLASRAGGDDPAREDRDDGSFGMSPPIACKEITGFEDYVPLEPAALTSDEKLLFYFRPRNYKTERQGLKYRAHLSVDAKIRKRGDKAVLWSKPKFADYDVTTEQPPRPIYFQNAVSLKALKPGEYALDIVVHDEIGQSRPAERTLQFKVVPVASKQPR